MIYSAEDKRKAIERELKYRHRVFKRRVEAGEMLQSFMDEQIAIFEAIREDYAKAEAAERLI